MARPLVVIVTGPPATGKTTIGRTLGEEFRLPFFFKDGFKEIIFDTLGWSDEEWSQKVDTTSREIIFSLLEAHLQAGQSLIVESTFRPDRDAERFRALRGRYDYLPFEVQCTGDAEELYRRFRMRAESSERHPGHPDNLNEREFVEIVRRGRNDAMDLGGAVCEVDTTAPGGVDYDALFTALRTARERRE